MAGLSREDRLKLSGPTLEDCQRLWDTIVTELVTDASLAFVMQSATMPRYRANIQVWSPGLDPETGAERRITWSIKDLPNGYVAITYNQLYGLLMDAYRAMEQKLGGQEELSLL